jgi:hypothetical protein
MGGTGIVPYSHLFRFQIEVWKRRESDFLMVTEIGNHL